VVLSPEQVPWSELNSVDLSGQTVVLRRNGGRTHKLGLNNFHNRAALHEGLPAHVPPKLLNA
jgi:hypothetical protein